MAVSESGHDYAVSPDLSVVEKGDLIHVDDKVRSLINLEIGGTIRFYGWESKKFQV